MRTEIDENGDVTGYYDILNWQLGDNGENAFLKVGEYIFTNSVFEVVMKKNWTIFWNTESSEVTLTSYFVYIYRELHFYIVSSTMKYQSPGVG